VFTFSLTSDISLSWLDVGDAGADLPSGAAPSGLIFQPATPRLTPWALFLRRFAAWLIICCDLCLCCCLSLLYLAPSFFALSFFASIFLGFNIFPSGTLPFASVFPAGGDLSSFATAIPASQLP